MAEGKKKQTRGRKKAETVIKEETPVEVLPAVQDDDGMVDEDELVEEAVRNINGMVQKGVHGTYIEVGNYVFKQFFRENIAEMRSFNPYKESSFKKLSEREDLLIKKAVLYRAVMVAVQERKLLPTDSTSNRLTFSHRVELLPLKDVAKKQELALLAAANNLSVQDLKSLVKEAREEEPKSEAGRPSLPGFLKSVKKSFGIFSKEGSLEGLNRETLDDLKDDEIQELQNNINHIISTVNQVNDALESILLSRKKEE